MTEEDVHLDLTSEIELLYSTTKYLMMFVGYLIFLFFVLKEGVITKNSFDVLLLMPAYLITIILFYSLFSLGVMVLDCD